MRYITLTEELKQQALQTVYDKLNTERCADSKLSLTIDLGNKVPLQNKIILNITAKAWLKMWSLVQTESKEIGWHGLVNREDTDVFCITDIMMYPQTTTATTVVTDDINYANWLHKEVSDEDIEKLRFHGHSHVNMTASPSGVDTTWYDQILQGLGNNDFYIFMILNKKEDMFIEIYDLATNTIYEKQDITVNVVLDENTELKTWINNQKEKYLTVEKPVSSWNAYGSTSYVDEDYVELMEILVNYTDLELQMNEDLTRELAIELAKYGYKTAYFGAGSYLNWSTLEPMEKINYARQYYNKTKDNVKPINSAKKTKTKKSKWR